VERIGDIVGELLISKCAAYTELTAYAIFDHLAADSGASASQTGDPKTEIPFLDDSGG